MQEQGLKQKDLAPILGGKNRVSEVLARKRPLTLAMVRALSESLYIPMELLVQDPRPKEDEAEIDREDPAVPIRKLMSKGSLSVTGRTKRSTAASVRAAISPPQGPLY